MPILQPYLKFNDDKCKEAMEFYQSILGGELTIQTVGESPMAKEMPGAENKVMHADLKNDKCSFFGSDMMRDKATVGDNIGISLNYTKEEEQLAREHFEKLSVGGEVFMPLEVAFWGDLFGMVTDKYGVEWMVNCSGK